MSALPFNFFDLVLLSVLVAGVITGRKHGLSEELLSLLKWLLILFVSALVYGPAGEFVAGTGEINLVSAYMITYVVVALGLLMGFSVLQRRLTPRLTGTDAFGRAEYYLGMGSGLVRCACMLLVALALLNARAFTPAELSAMKAYQEAEYGSSIFPGLHSLQELVFEKSLSGPWIKNELGFLLISPTTAMQTEPESPKRNSGSKSFSQVRPS